MHLRPFQSTFAVLFCSVSLSSIAVAQDNVGQPAGPEGEPNPLKNVYFGEQHLHTVNSPDAFAMGTRNTPDDAFNFCKGEAVVKNTSGDTVQRRTPYDWCAITDHAEYFGVLKGLIDPDSDISVKLKDNPIVQAIQSGDPAKGDKAFGEIAIGLATNNPDPNFNRSDIIKTNWDEYVSIADKHNDPGTFSTLVAFEWTSIPNNMNLHRNVFFRDSGPALPFSAFDSDWPEDLWTYIGVQRAAGHDAFAIPHNANLSNGRMFAPRNSAGMPIDERYAERRSKYEVAIEMSQVKGQSETHPALSPNDEFAGFESQYYNLIGTNPPVRGQVENSYVRQGLIAGVGYQEYLGVNPFKLGIVGGADSHTAFNTNEEFNYSGSHGLVDATLEARLSGAAQTAGEAAINFGSPGTTAVWAPENTREAIFDGIKSRETYGTSGTLIRLRVFGGWDLPDDMTQNGDFVETGYEMGVPMGRDLPEHPSGDLAKSPKFAVWALKDPESGNLDRIQIVKGWYQNGYPQEKVFDVVWSDQNKRQIDETTGKLAPVGNTVNIAEATYTNEIGATQLRTTWTDPEFDPTQHAVYYVRVLEIPTPRWSTYDAKELGIEPPEGVSATIQERAWSSPIWYTPAPDLVTKAPAYPNLYEITK